MCKWGGGAYNNYTCIIIHLYVRSRSTILRNASVYETLINSRSAHLDHSLPLPVDVVSELTGSSGQINHLHHHVHVRLTTTVDLVLTLLQTSQIFMVGNSNGMHQFLLQVL